MIAERSRPLAIRLAIGLAAASSLAGCGLGAGRAPTAIQLTVTRDFGTAPLRSWRAPHARGEETVMSLLMRNASVSTRYGGGFVESIDGVSGGQQGGRPVDWFYYVNGIEASKGAASTKLHAGDHIWWDRHDWSQTDHVPAVVGSFPEPFLNGVGGKRLPVRVECALVGGYACRAVTERLHAAGAPAALAAAGTGAAPQTLRVVVGPWSAAAGDPTAGAIKRGPSASGVYARFSPNGRTLIVLDQSGRPARTLGAGAGLIAATAIAESAPVWVVTGTDSSGVERAARSFSGAVLADRFAVAVAPSGRALAAPQVTP